MGLALEATLYWEGIGHLGRREYIDRILYRPISFDTQDARACLIPSPLSVADVLERDRKRDERRELRRKGEIDEYLRGRAK